MKKRLLFLLPIIIGLCGLSLIATAQEPLEIGEKAIPFELPGVDGKTYTLDDFSDSDILALIFTCNHCPTAQAYESRMKQMVKDYQDNSVAIVAISPNDPQAVRLDELGYSDVGDSFEDMKYRAKDQEFNFPYLYGGDATETMKKYGPRTTPHVFIFDENRELRFRGRIDDKDNPEEVTSKDMRNAIDALIAGEEVPVKTTNTFGCSVKWPDKRDSAKESLEKWNKETAELKEIKTDGIKELMKNDTDKVRLINFWATWCGPCVQEFPDLVEMHRMYRHRDFEFVTVSLDTSDKKEDVQEFLNKYNASGTNYIFAGDNVYDVIDTVDSGWTGAIPFTVIVKSGGEVYYSHEGIIDPLEARGKIVDLIGRTYF